MKIIRKRKKLIKNQGEIYVASQLQELGLNYVFEPHSFDYTVASTYTPDFCVNYNKGKMYIEVKGYHVGMAMWCNKIVHFIKQHPEIDFRIVFLDASKKFNKKYKSNLGDWATKHNIIWSDKGKIPREWFE